MSRAVRVRFPSKRISGLWFLNVGIHLPAAEKYEMHTCRWSNGPLTYYVSEGAVGVTDDEPSASMTIPGIRGSMRKSVRVNLFDAPHEIVLPPSWLEDLPDGTDP